MNLSLDEYIEGFEQSVHSLPEVFSEWETIDDDLREAYGEQLSWMLRVRGEALRAAPEKRYIEIAQRLAHVVAVLFEMRSLLADLMGITQDRIVPYNVTYAEEASAAPGASSMAA